jgi:hypothetical protein
VHVLCCAVPVLPLCGSCGIHHLPTLPHQQDCFYRALAQTNAQGKCTVHCTALTTAEGKCTLHCTAPLHKAIAHSSIIPPLHGANREQEESLSCSGPQCLQNIASRCVLPHIFMSTDHFIFELAGISCAPHRQGAEWGAVGGGGDLITSS